MCSIEGSYRLVRCANNKKEHNNNIMFERNLNASKNMTKIMRNIIVHKNKGVYKKKKQKTEEKIENFINKRGEDKSHNKSGEGREKTILKVVKLKKGGTIKIMGRKK